MIYKYNETGWAKASDNMQASFSYAHGRVRESTAVAVHARRGRVGENLPYPVMHTGLNNKQEDKFMGFSKIEVVTAMSRLDDLKAALSRLGVSGMTVMQVIGCGVQNGTFEYEAKKNQEMELLPKQMISIIVEDEAAGKVIDTIKKELYTGHIGDGKIFVTPLSNVIRVRTGEEGTDALK